MANKRKDTGKDKIEVDEFGAAIDTGDEFVSEVSPASAEISLELTEEEKIKLEAEARTEVAQSMKLAKMKQFKAAAKKRLQTEAMFRHGKDDKGQDLDTVDLNLASYPKFIMLDGVMYYSGRRYTKSRAVVQVLKDQMDRGWRQEAARLGEKTEWVEQKQKLLSRQGLQLH